MPGSSVAWELVRERFRYRADAVYDPAAEFVLATNSFRSAGSGGFAGCRADRVILDDRTPSRTVLSAFLSAGAWNGRNGAFDWGLDSVGCSVTFDSAEKSLFHLDEIAPLHPTPVAGAAPGFQRFRLWV
jgi:2',3'-cyclic-nucleotide 2'-phosphodiesterase/3'-nucleotidase